MNVPISQVTIYSDTVYFSGIPPVDKMNALVGENNFTVQTRFVLKRLAEILRESESSIDSIIFLNVYLNDIKLINEFNEIYIQFMSNPYPARKVIETKFSIEGVLIELSGIASQEKYKHAINYK